MDFTWLKLYLLVSIGLVLDNDSLSMHFIPFFLEEGIFKNPV